MSQSYHNDNHQRPHQQPLASLDACTERLQALAQEIKTLREVSCQLGDAIGTLKRAEDDLLPVEDSIAQSESALDQLTSDRQRTQEQVEDKKAIIRRELEELCRNTLEVAHGSIFPSEVPAIIQQLLEDRDGRFVYLSDYQKCMKALRSLCGTLLARRRDFLSSYASDVNNPEMLSAHVGSEHEQINGRIAALDVDRRELEGQIRNVQKMAQKLVDAQEKEELGKEKLGRLKTFLDKLREHSDEARANSLRSSLRIAAVIDQFEGALQGVGSEMLRVVEVLQADSRLSAGKRDAYGQMSELIKTLLGIQVDAGSSDPVVVCVQKHDHLRAHCEHIKQMATSPLASWGWLDGLRRFATGGSAESEMPARRGRLDVITQWLDRSVVDRVLEIDNRCAAEPWSRDELINVLGKRNAVGMVAESKDGVVGFMVYSLSKTSLELLRFAVDPDYERRGVGSAMVDTLLSKIGKAGSKRQKLEVWVPEESLSTQLFFRANSFWASGAIVDGKIHMVYPKPSSMW
jgi:GNAT superfamily N-acetyltransferase